MSTRVIVVTSGKGGVGKTTTTTNIGLALAQLGHKILLVDADIGLRNLDLLLGLEQRVVFTGFDVLDGSCNIKQALVKDKREPLLTFFSVNSNQLKYRISTEQLVDLLNVRDKIDIQVRRLSLGERMKMEIIASLLHSPSIVLLDEPRPNKEYVYTLSNGQKYKGNWRNTAGWTTVLISGKIIKSIGPIFATNY